MSRREQRRLWAVPTRIDALEDDVDRVWRTIKADEADIDERVKTGDEATLSAIASLRVEYKADMLEIRSEVRGMRGYLIGFALSVAGSALVLCGTIIVAVRIG